MRTHPWFSARAYQHIDRAIGIATAKALTALPSAVARHPFLPFIHYDDEVRRYGGKHGLRIKSRPIHYAGHQDSAIYAFYAYQLSERYEALLLQEGLSDCIIAYRRLGRSNIDFAGEAFGHVRARSTTTTLCFDIESFFPSLDHGRLKATLEHVLGQSRLQDDWFAVYRSVTSYSWVDLKDVEKIRGRKLESARQGRALSVAQFHDMRARGMVWRNLGSRGIPQGSPISALLANIYMIDFDRSVAAEAQRRGATYRRYSDDILVICGPADAAHFHNLIVDQLKALGLTQNAKKFEQSNFTINGNRITCDKPLQYLGFTFDGEQALIRSSSLSRFYRRMSKAVRKVAIQAAVSIRAGKTKKLYRRKLYENFSPLGLRNFLSGYALRAQKKIGSNGIALQTKRASVILKSKIKKMEVRYNLPTK